ncbi:unnamed protein product [Spirodela intermedia]|uniref:Uncharacterized protein n=1 Tax=Spirodela intermedia TaxID=51605 RepID=A0A7I8IJH6_SPIIN|nr:unnamed protein product [Spirodela intermedia]CAA6657998.1 unnamed protein product [Spirodela intermedia]
MINRKWIWSLGKTKTSPLLRIFAIRSGQGPWSSLWEIVDVDCGDRECCSCHGDLEETEDEAFT